MLPGSFTAAMVAIISWILSLIHLSSKLHDVPSASIGISIIAIPLFLLFLGLFWYVFLGIHGAADDQERGSEEARESEGEGE